MSAVEATALSREEIARRIAPLGWHGVAMMEYKRDRRTGEQRWLLAKATVLDDDERLVVTIIEDVTGAR